MRVHSYVTINMANVNSDQQHLENAVNFLSLGDKGEIFDQLRRKNATSSVDCMKKCFEVFDADR